MGSVQAGLPHGTPPEPLISGTEFSSPLNHCYVWQITSKQQNDLMKTCLGCIVYSWTCDLVSFSTNPLAILGPGTRLSAIVAFLFFSRYQRALRVDHKNGEPPALYSSSVFRSLVQKPKIGKGARAQLWSPTTRCPPPQREGIS